MNPFTDLIRESPGIRNDQSIVEDGLNSNGFCISDRPTSVNPFQPDNAMEERIRVNTPHQEQTNNLNIWSESVAPENERAGIISDAQPEKFDTFSLHSSSSGLQRGFLNDNKTQSTNNNTNKNTCSPGDSASSSMDILNLDPNMALSLPELEDPFKENTYSLSIDHPDVDLMSGSYNDNTQNIKVQNNENLVDKYDQVGPDVASIEADVSFSSTTKVEQTVSDDLQNNNNDTEAKDFPEHESEKDRHEAKVPPPANNDEKYKSELRKADFSDKKDFNAILRKKQKPKPPPKPKDDGIDITEVEPGLVLMKRLSKEWRMPVINSKLQFISDQHSQQDLKNNVHSPFFLSTALSHPHLILLNNPSFFCLPIFPAINQVFTLLPMEIFKMGNGGRGSRHHSTRKLPMYM